jgi:hypothetical protein
MNIFVLLRAVTYATPFIGLLLSENSARILELFGEIPEGASATVILCL